LLPPPVFLPEIGQVKKQSDLKRLTAQYTTHNQQDIVALISDREM
jgi:hypothetical protein